MKVSWLERLVACIALAWLVFMAWSGRPMQQGQFVAFEAAGLMPELPEAVSRVTLSREGQTRVLERRGATDWTLDARPLSPAVAPRLMLAIKFLHTARPLRELGKDATDAGYGFDATALHVSVARAGQPALELVFGKPGSEATTQYAVGGPTHAVWLMSRFVGEEWEAVWDGVR